MHKITALLCLLAASQALAGPHVDSWKWRSAETHVAPGLKVKTTAARETAIKKMASEQESTILGEATPVYEFEAEAKVRFDYLWYGNYTTGKIGRVSVGNLGPEGKLRGTMILPVSGHTGVDNARKWAVTDTYELLVEDVAGQRPIASQIPSKGLVTFHDVEVQLAKDQVVKLLYYRNGSAGIWGFAPGRTIELVWDGT